MQAKWIAIGLALAGLGVVIIKPDVLTKIKDKVGGQ